MRTGIIRRAGRAWFEIAVAGLALAIVGGVLARAVFWHSLAEVAPINAGDFLVSYSGGFVRRGLVGALLYRLPFVTDLHRAEVAIKTLSLMAYCASFAMLTATVRRYTRSTATTLLVVLQPFLFGFPVLTGQWIKADLILLLGFYACLRWIGGRRAVMSGWRMLPVNLVSIAAIATHETYGVAMLPVLILVAASRDDPARRPWAQSLPRALAAFAPSVTAVLVVSAFPGNALVARRIQDAWAARGIVLGGDTTPALFGFTHTHVWRMGFDIVADNYADKPFFFLFWGSVIVVSGALVCLAAGLIGGADPTDTAPAAYDWRRARESAGVMGLTLIAFAPLFLMATDFGRWVFLWIATSAGIVFSPVGGDLIELADRALPRPIAIVLRRARAGTPRQGSPWTASRSWCVGLLAGSLFLVPLPAYVMEGCCTVRYVMSFSVAARVVRLVLGH